MTKVKPRSIFIKVFTGEIKMIFTDAGAILIFFLALFIYPFLYALTYENETVRDLPVAVVDMDHTSLSRQYARMMDATEQLKVACKPSSMEEAKTLFYENNIKGVILIPSGFEKKIYQGQSAVATVYCDASFFLLYKQVFTGISYSTGTLSAKIEIQHMLAEGKPMEQAIEMQSPLNVKVNYLYNPVGGYAHFIVPAILFIILQQTLLIGISMLGGTIREKRKFMGMIAYAQKPWATVEMLFAKASAYTLLYLINSVLCLGLMYRFYNLPERSDILPLVVVLIPAFYAISFLGLAISMAFKERVHAYVFLVFLSPAVVFLSGVTWPAISIPDVMQYFAKIFPSTFVVPSLIKLRIFGGDFSGVSKEFISVAIQLVIYFTAAFFSYRYAIRKFTKRLMMKQKAL